MKNLKIFLKSEKGLLFIWLFLSCIGIMMQIRLCSSYFLTYDSAYQYALTSHSFKEIFALLPQDYSPPFYAILLKCISLLFGEQILIYRLCNGIILSGMLYLALFPVRKAFGLTSGLISALLMLCSIFNMRMFHDIRPTYLACFLVTGLVIYGWLAFFEYHRRNLICFTIFAVLCMYTHNIALVAAFGVYITCLGGALFCRDQKKFFAFLISGVCCVILYLPWLFILIQQIQKVYQHFWEGEQLSAGSTKLLLFDSIFSYEDNTLITAILDLLPRVGLLLILLKYIHIAPGASLGEFIHDLKAGFAKCRRSAGKYLFLALELIMPLMVFALINQNFHNLATLRYYFIFTGASILLMAIPVAKSGKKVLCFGFSLLTLANFGNIYHILLNKMPLSQGRQMVDDIRAANPDGDITFVHIHEWSVGTMTYFFPDATHYIYQDTWTVLNDLSVFPAKIIQIGELEHLPEYTTEFYLLDQPVLNSPVFDSAIFGDSFQILDQKIYDYELFCAQAYPEKIQIKKVRIGDEPLA